MVLYELSFPPEDRQNISELYYRAAPSGAAMQSAEGLQIKAGATICFDSYFNILSHAAYSQYTALKAVGVRLNIRGSFTLRVRFASAEEPLKEDVILAVDTLHCKSLQSVTCTFPLQESVSEGFYYLELTALSEILLTEGAFCVPDESRVRESRMAIVICTYRREAYLRRNIEEMLNFFSAPKRQSFWERVDILVVDNGQTLAPEAFGYSHITVIPNENTGGSGGFGRGMLEVRRRGFYTHFCLMDDDIVLNPSIILRTLSFLDICAEDFSELSVGGAMLSLEAPWEQYEMGGRFTGYRCISLKTGLDLRQRESLIINERPERPDFNAWWYMCMPSAYIERYGLPFPFFIKGDDIDYSLRTGQKIVVMNGIGVWHEDFNGKDFGMSEYYIKRNELILCALHKKRPSLMRNYKKLLFAVGKQLLMRRYAVVKLLLRAYDDFLAGPEAFLATNQAALHSELAECMPPLKSFEEVADKRQVRCIEVTGCSLKDFRYTGEIFQYSQKTKMGFLSKPSLKEPAKAAVRLCEMFIKMLLRFNVVCEALQKLYRENASDVIYPDTIKMTLYSMR